MNQIDKRERKELKHRLESLSKRLTKIEKIETKFYDSQTEHMHTTKKNDNSFEIRPLWGNKAFEKRNKMKKHLNKTQEYLRDMINVWFNSDDSVTTVSKYQRTISKYAEDDPRYDPKAAGFKGLNDYHSDLVTKQVEKEDKYETRPKDGPGYMAPRAKRVLFPIDEPISKRRASFTPE